MTYKEIAEIISNMTPEQRGQDAAVFVPGVDEVIPVGDVRVGDEDETFTDRVGDVLDPGSVVIFLA